MLHGEITFVSLSFCCDQLPLACVLHHLLLTSRCSRCSPLLLKLHLGYALIMQFVSSVSLLVTLVLCRPDGFTKHSTCPSPVPLPSPQSTLQHPWRAKPLPNIPPSPPPMTTQLPSSCPPSPATDPPRNLPLTPTHTYLQTTSTCHPKQPPP